MKVRNASLPIWTSHASTVPGVMEAHNKCLTPCFRNTSLTQWRGQRQEINGGCCNGSVGMFWRSWTGTRGVWIYFLRKNEHNWVNSWMRQLRVREEQRGCFWNLQLELCSIEHRKRKKAWRAVVERRKGKGKIGLVGTFSLRRSICNTGSSQVAQW